jgi:hypothetical protein
VTRHQARRETNVTRSTNVCVAAGTLALLAVVLGALPLAAQTAAAPDTLRISLAEAIHRL